MNKKIILPIVLTTCLVLAVSPIQVQAEQTNLLEMILDFLFPQPQPEAEFGHIKILNPVSKPELWGLWIVRFETVGTGDLEIEAYKGTFFEKHIEFIRLNCGNETIEVESYFSGKTENEPWVEGIDNGRIIARNWNCDNKRGALVLRILETGRHHMGFSFLGETAYAENLADCTGTAAVPCHMCDVSDMDFLLRDPSDTNDPRGWQDMTFSSETGSCPPYKNETWTDADGYTFCPSEGGYDAQTRAYAEGDSWEWETSAWFTNVYTVNYDTVENWCDCNQTATGCNGLSCWGGTNAMSWESGTTQSCCGDDAVEYYNFRNEHFSGAEIWFDDDATDDACCNADGDCVYDGTCYASGVFDLNGDTFKEARCYTSSGTWINTDYHSSYCGLGGYNWDVGGGDATGDNYAGTWGGTTSGYCHNRSIEEGGGFVASIHCCCGDDSGENKITSTYGASIENPPSPSTDACCDVSTDCVNASTCYANSATLDVDSNGDDDVCSSVTWIDCTTVAHCDPAGEYAEGEGSQACYGSSDCNEACTSNDCIYKRYNGFSDCDLETACVSGNCMQDTEYAGTAAAGACDNTDGCICNTCGTWDTCIPSDGCPFDNDWDEIMSDCYNPADQGGNCYASSGDTNKDVDNDGDNDYCSSGTWYDCLNNNQCTAPYECVNNDCNNTIPSGSGTTCDAANPCLYVEDSSSVVKARFDDNGYVDIKGGLYENESGPLSCSTCFQIKDSGGTLRLYIDSNGNLYSLGYFITDSTPTASGNNDFQIKDSGGTVVGFIDGATGNMYFKGNLHYNSNF